MSRTFFEQGRILMGRLPAEVDLLEAIARIANEEEIRCGTVQAFGSLAQVSLASLLEESPLTPPTEINEPVEIGSASGTLSLFKRRVLPRINCVVSTRAGTVSTGLLARGSVVRSCEVVIVEYTGGSLSRDFDPATGLPEWKPASFLI